MNDTSFIGLVQNAALLLAVAFIFDVVASRWHTGQSPFRQALVGLALGAIGITVMLTPWTFGSGIVFDTRSVLIGISGLFFGLVSTAIAMVMTVAFRFYQGGTGVWTGIAVILTSGAIGIAWRYFRRRSQTEISWRELYLFGIVIHLSMLGLMLTLPWETALRVLSSIALPVILIYPLGTAMLGVLMVNRLRRERAEEVLKVRERSYRSLAENLPGIVYRVHIHEKGNMHFLNNMLLPLTGYNEKELTKGEVCSIDPLIVAEDRDRVISEVKAAIKDNRSFDIEYRITHKDETPRFLIERGRPIFDNDVLHCIDGIIQDVTPRRLAEEALRESELKYRTLVEGTNNFVFMVDRKGLFTYVNPNFEIATGYSLSDLKGHPFTIVVAPDERETTIDRFKKGVRGAPSLPYETELLGKEGNRVAVEFLASNLCDSRGNVTGRFGVGRDITKRKEMEALLKDSEKRYRELSIIDDLTQLYNSRYFYDQLKKELGRVNRYEEHYLTLLLLDLDDFKQFNDAYGHVEGDQVLSRLGQVVKRCLRQTDSAYRYGGEEFTILLPMTTSKDAAITAERIRTEFKKENFPLAPGEDVHVTVSIGLAQYKPQEDMKAFVHRADQLMYQAKKNGKDRVCSEYISS